MGTHSDHPRAEQGGGCLNPAPPVAQAAGPASLAAGASAPLASSSPPASAARLPGLVGYEYDPSTGKLLWGADLPLVLGYGPRDLDGTVDQWVGWLHPEDRARVVARLREFEAQPCSYDVEYRLRHRDGNHRWVRDRGCFLHGPAGREAARRVGSIEGIADPGATGDALSLNEQRLDALLRLSQMTEATLPEITHFALEQAVRLTRSTVGYLAFVNDDESMLTMHSWSASAMAECGVTHIPWHYPVATAGLWGEAVRQRRPVITNDYQAPNALKRGLPAGHVPISRHMNIPVFEGTKIVAVAGVGNKSGPYDEADVRQLALLMQGMWRLVQRQRADQALRESETRYRGVVENTLMGIAVSKDETLLYANQTLIRMSGYDSFAELAAKPVSAHLTPASAAVAEAHFLARAGGEAVPAEFDVDALRKDGTVRTLRLCTSPVWIDGRRCELSTLLDVTEQRRTEQERLDMQRRLLHAQKLESLGVLAGGIAHDFNNLLMAILGNLDMALSELSPAVPAFASIEQARQASHRAADLTRELLAYSGRGRFVLRRLDLGALVRQTADLLRAALPRSVTLDLQLGPEPAVVEVDPGQIQQVAMNLITNASEAIGERAGTVILRTGVLSCDELDLAPSRLEEKPAPGRFAYIEVRDTGCGMDETTQQRLFDPFFTTKATGRGLGMSAVLGIVRGHRGAVLVNSEVGRGSAIRVLLPALVAGVADEAPAAAAVAGPPPALVLRGLLLVVDDDEAVRALALAYAKRLGIVALGAADGVEALALFRLHADRIACVLLDLTMPRLDGVATYRELKRLRPDVPIILCSGYTEPDAAQRFRGEGLAGFLQKPYGLRQLRGLLEGLPEQAG